MASNSLSGARVEKEGSCVLRAELELLGPGGQGSIQGKGTTGASAGPTACTC